jgi:ABC-type transport system involved in cytochrome bd biosynthesis fused ATPase/permease subunit
MRLQQWSEFSQIVSAIAVVASLVYVGSEISGNTEATRGATRQAALQADLTYLSATLDPATLLTAEAKLESGLVLASEERLVLVERQHVNFRLFENAFYQFQAGLLVPERWETYRRIISSRLAENEPTQVMWAKYQSNFDAAFQVEVNSIRDAL